MLFPNKLCSYNDSILSKFPSVLKVVKKEPISVLDLYHEVIGYMNGANEFIDILDCLYALQKIKYDDENGVLVYVA